LHTVIITYSLADLSLPYFNYNNNLKNTFFNIYVFTICRFSNESEVKEGEEEERVKASLACIAGSSSIMVSELLLITIQ